MTLTAEKIVDPLPTVHRFFQKVSEAIGPKGSGRSERAAPGVRKYWIGLIVFCVVMQVTVLVILPKANIDPAKASFRSETTFLGLPLYAQGKNPVAWVAVGGVPVGVIAIGGVSIGLFSLGGLSIGLFSLGGLAFGLIAIGGGALGLLIAIGGGAIGFYAFGGVAVGGIAYAGGGVARGYYVASGGQSEKLWGGGSG